jgi:MscS family membrane protein
MPLRSLAIRLLIVCAALAGAPLALAAQEGSGFRFGSGTPVHIPEDFAVQVGAAQPWLLNEVVGIALWRWLGFFVTFGVLFVLRRGARWLMRLALRRIGAQVSPEGARQVLEALDRPVGVLLFAFVAWMASIWLALDLETAAFVYQLWRIAAIAAVGWAVMRSTDLLVGGLANLATRSQTSLDEHLVPLVGRIVRIAVAGLIVVLVVQELGYNVGGFLAGLGIGGLAFALAAQDTLANWFGAATMYSDRPFEIGDWIKTGDIEGTVQDIGLRSTRIRTFTRTEISVPNKTLAAASIENLSRMDARRVRFTLGLTYSTSAAQIADVVRDLRALLAEHEGVERETSIVRFTDFGASSLDIVVVYFTTDTTFDGHLAVRETVGLEVMRILERNGVDVAFPSQSIYLETVPSRVGEAGLAVDAVDGAHELPATAADAPASPSADNE